MSAEEFAARALADNSLPPVIVITSDTEGFCSTISKWPSDIESLTIILPNAEEPKIRIRDKSINRVEIRQVRPVMLSKCRIRTLDVHDHARLTLEDCFVETMKMNGIAFDDLHIEGGCLFRPNTHSSAGRGENPFQGRVTIKGLHIPRTKDYLRTPSSDEERAFRMYECRNIRNFLTAKNDVLAAGPFHSAELALERDDDSGPSWCINWFYEHLSDYGNSTLLPLVWTASTYITLVLIVLFANSVVTPEMKAELLGWQKNLSDCRLLRAVAYPFYAIFNPLNLFTPRPLMVSANWFWAFVHSVKSLFGTLNIALFVLAVRRRFKLD